MSIMDSMQQHSEGHDRRRDCRENRVCEAWVCSPTATSPKERLDVTSVNLSKHGIAFDSTRPIPVESYLKIELHVGNQNITSEIRIIHCEPLENGHYNVGGRFC